MYLSEQNWHQPNASPGSFECSIGCSIMHVTYESQGFMTWTPYKNSDNLDSTSTI